MGCGPIGAAVRACTACECACRPSCCIMKWSSCTVLGHREAGFSLSHELSRSAELSEPGSSDGCSVDRTSQDDAPGRGGRCHKNRVAQQQLHAQAVSDDIVLDRSKRHECTRKRRGMMIRASRLLVSDAESSLCRRRHCRAHQQPSGCWRQASAMPSRFLIYSTS